MGQMKVNVPLDQLKDRVCPCGCLVFSQAVTLKEIPSLYSPSGVSETAITPVGFVCATCGELIPLRPEPPEMPKVVLAKG